jgi:superfamily II DNA/RNA helicase
LLLCTDVAARGIDIAGLPYVVNMTLPDESEDYLHRVGRVGRAGCMGLAISIVGGEGIAEKVIRQYFLPGRRRGAGGAATCYNAHAALL